VPANCPRIAWVTAVGGCSIKLYMNMDEVVAMVLEGGRKSALLDGCKRPPQTERKAFEIERS
jgi:hypothetical protein